MSTTPRTWRTTPILSLVCCCWAVLAAGCGQRVVGSVPPGAGGSGGSGTGTGGSAAEPALDAGAPVPDAPVADAPPADAPASDAPAADAPAPTPDLPSACTLAGWCWTHPLPSSDRYVQAFGVGPDDLWLIGAAGTIVRYAGGKWSAVPSPADALSSIWASASTDVWVGGPDGPWHWDGGKWTRPLLPTDPGSRAVNAIWGCAPDDVWMMGPVATHWDGSTLAYVDMPRGPGGFHSVWGSACNDVWGGFVDDTVGSGRITHWDGNTWTTTESRPAERIAGTGPGDVWSLAQGQLYHWSGLGPAMLQDGRTLGLFPVGAGAVGTMRDDRTISVLAPSGATALPAPAPQWVAALWGRTPSDIWGFGAAGAATRWDGAAWTVRLPGWTAASGDATAVIGTGPTDLWAAVGGALLRGDGKTWRRVLAPEDVGGRILGLWASGPDDVWVLGGDSVIHRLTGGKWTTDDPLPHPASGLEMHAISGTGPNDVWVLRGTNSVLHWDGSTWISRQPIVNNLYDVWAAGPNDAWVAGDSVLHWHGDAWSATRTPPELYNTSFTKVSGSNPTDVWVLAGGSVLKMRDDNYNMDTAVSSGWRATALAPAPGGGVWALFQDGTTASRLYHLVGTDPNANGNAVIAPAGLAGLGAATDGTLWAAGASGALLRRAPP